MKLYCGDSEQVLKSIPDNSIDSIVCDPPYGIHLNKVGWDKGLPSLNLWRECYRVLKPGAYIIGMSAARMYHYLACTMEEAGFITHPMLGWIYGSGLPKGCNLARQMDQQREVPDDVFRNYLKSAMKIKGLTAKKMNELCGFKGMFAHYVGKGQAQYPSPKHWNRIKEILELDDRYDKVIHRNKNRGRLTTLPPKKDALFSFSRKVKDYEPKSDLSRKWQGYKYGLQTLKPAIEPIYIGQKPHALSMKENILTWGVGAMNINACRIELDKSYKRRCDGRIDERGRYPSNILHDGSKSIIDEIEKQSQKQGAADYFNALSLGVEDAARFLYTSKPSQTEKGKGNNHPTVKPIRLMEHLIKLVTPPEGICLDPFMGSGSTGIAAIQNSFSFVGIEMDEGFFEIARDRLIQASCKWYEDRAKSI